MGPLLNPARPTHQLLGVGNPKTHDLVARALAKSNVQRAAVVHGGGGFDELTPCGVSRVILVQGGRCEEIELDPESFGMRRSEPDELGCRDRADSLDMMRAVLKGQGPQPVLDMLGLNLGLSLHLLEESASLQECVERAKDQVRQGIDLSAETLGCGAAA
jgi:anthranilate phosphoribosyltransferase